MRQRRMLSTRGAAFLACFAALVAVALFAADGSRSAYSRPIPPPAVDANQGPDAGSEVAVLAGGCFWGVQGVFQHVVGVSGAVSGYTGGDRKTAHYDLVGTGTTGHAEAVRITFDPRKVSYGRILQIF